MAITIDTKDFRNTHGDRTPRGFGTWGFEAMDSEDDRDSHIWIDRSTYGQAKREAIEIAKDRGFTQLVLLP